MVEFGNPVQHGVIKRIETAVDSSEGIAEVETVSYVHEYCNLHSNTAYFVVLHKLYVHVFIRV